MSDLNDLEIAIIHEEKDGIKGFIDKVDRKSANVMLAKAGEHFGFKTMEVDGIQRAVRSDVAKTMGYASESGLSMLCDRYDIKGISIGTFSQNVKRSIRNFFGLHPNDGSTVLVSWDVFLVVGMVSTNEPARKVKAYLLECERRVRIVTTARKLAKADPAINDAGKVVNMIDRADRIKNADLREKALLYIDDVLEGLLDISPMTGLFEDRSE